MFGRGSEKSRGQSLAEFSIAIPLFLIIVIAVAEGGFYVAASTIVSSATHEGARLGVLEGTSARSTIRSRVKQTAGPIVALENSQIKLKIAKVQEDGSHASLTNCDNDCYQARKQDDRLVVTTTYAHTPLVGYVFPGLTFPASATAELIVEGDAHVA